MVVYGERLSLRGDTKEGLALLLAAERKGSLYAYYGFSRVFRETPGLRNDLLAASYLRVAYILGDTKAAQQMLKDFPGYGAVDYAAVDRRASELYRTMTNQQRPMVRPSS